MADVQSKLSTVEKVAAVRASYETASRGDLRKAAEGLADDVVFHSALRKQDFKGREAVLAEQLKQQAEFKAEYKLHDLAASEEHMVALLQVTQEVGGKRETHQLVHVLHVDDEGKAKEVWSIFNG